MTRQRFFLLVGICISLAVAAWLSRLSSTDTQKTENKSSGVKKETEEVIFPRYRSMPKHTKRPKAVKPSQDKQEARHVPNVSPIERAVFSSAKQEAVFVEFSAIRNSSFVEKLLNCQGNEFASQWEKSVQALGYDWQRDIDRLAISPDAMVMSGFFQNAKIPEGFGDEIAYGNGAKIYQPDPTSPMRYVVVDENLLAMTKDIEAAEQLVDRVEGRSPIVPTTYPHMMENEVYGQISASMISMLLANDAPLSSDIAELVDKISLRMEVDDHLSVSLDVESKDAKKSVDLAKSVGGLLALARREAALAGDDELASLLEMAQVLPGADGKFGVDFAVPETWALNRMGCDENGAPAPEAQIRQEESLEPVQED
jgi:hypothetical protein